MSLSGLSWYRLTVKDYEKETIYVTFARTAADAVTQVEVHIGKDEGRVAAVSPMQSWPTPVHRDRGTTHLDTETGREVIVV